MAIRPALRNTIATGFRSITGSDPAEWHAKANTSNGVRTNGQYPTEQQPEPESRLLGKTTIPTAFPNGNNARSSPMAKHGSAGQLPGINCPERPTLRQPQEADRWPMRAGFRWKPSPAGPVSRSPCARNRLVLCGHRADEPANPHHFAGTLQSRQAGPRPRRRAESGAPAR